MSRCTTGHRPAAHRSVSGPASASLHRPPGALGSGAVNSRPAPFCLCVRFCFAAPRQLLRLLTHRVVGRFAKEKAHRLPNALFSGSPCWARTNDHSEPGNCRAAPRATGPRHIALFPGPPPPRCIAHRARSAPAQLTAAPRRFVCAFGFALPHPVSSCGCERTGSLPLCKRKSAPVTRCAFFWLPLLGSNQRPCG